MKIEFLGLAQQELDDAFNYYEYQQRNLGYRFVEELHKSIELIKLYPTAWSKSSKNTRRAIVKTFPYAIIYQRREEMILIIAVAHLHREPNYWIERI